MATAAVIAAHFVIRSTSHPETAERLSRAGRHSFPVLIVVTNAVLVLIFV